MSDELPDSVPPAENVVPFKADADDASKQGSEKKSRRGKAVKKKKGEPAKFESGDAQGPRDFDAAAVAEEMHLYWSDGDAGKYIIGTNVQPKPGNGDRALFEDRPQSWSKWPEKKLISYLRKKCWDRGQALRIKVREGEVNSEAEQVLIHVMEHRQVDGAIWGLAGYGAGLHAMPSGERLIVRKSPAPVQPKHGEWGLVKELIEGRLDLSRDEGGQAYNVLDDQVIYYHAWHQTVLRSLLYGSPGNWTQRPLLVLAGPVGCGKSRLQVNVTNGLLGGRVANPKSYLTGKENFNENMVKAEHLMMEELDNVSQKMVDRLAFSESVKALVANTGVTLRLMRVDPMTIMPFWAATLSMNNDPDKLRSFPPLTPDFRDKVIMLLVRREPLPMPTRTDGEKRLFNQAIAAELPAYAHWLLNEFEIPEPLLKDEEGRDATRFGCRSWQHPSLARELFDDSPASELLQMIDAAEFRDPVNGGEGIKLWDIVSHANGEDDWEGRADELQTLMAGEHPEWSSSMARQMTAWAKHHKCDRVLGRLAEDLPNRVKPHRTNIERRWIIIRAK